MKTSVSPFEGVESRVFFLIWSVWIASIDLLRARSGKSKNPLVITIKLALSSCGDSWGTSKYLGGLQTVHSLPTSAFSSFRTTFYYAESGMVLLLLEKVLQKSCWYPSKSAVFVSWVQDSFLPRSSLYSSSSSECFRSLHVCKIIGIWLISWSKDNFHR